MEIALGQLPDSTGVDLGISSWLTIDQAQIDTFGGVTKDEQWIHIDPARAGSGPYGTTIAHGYLTLSLMSNMLLELLVVPDATSVINYGLDRVRFPSPVPSGSRIRGRGELISVTTLDTSVQTTVRITVECDVSRKPAAVAEVLSRFIRP
jgi:acyl dehydratase